MSLIPIIYTSLLIFSGITVVVVLFSFISYKIKGEKVNNNSVGSPSPAFNMQPAYQTGGVRGSNFVNQKIIQRNHIRSSYERKRAEIRLGYLNELQRTKQNYIAREFDHAKERKTAPRLNRRFEVVTTFERESPPEPTTSYEKQSYNYNDNSFMNYYSNESDVYYPPTTKS